MSEALEIFQQLLKDNRETGKTGICSICSAHEEVIKAGMLQADRDASIVLIEATSNQVNQFGGYTGMRAAQFVDYVYGIADEMHFPRERILLGGDHLGPNSWQQETAAKAMEKAVGLVRSYVRAGFRKIHLDASMFLADDEGDRHQPLADEIVAARAAVLCEACEQEWETSGAGTAKPLYIIGTEVPIPGGAQEAEDSVTPTSTEDAKKTISVARETFLEKGLSEAWERVVALVVQPGVEFGDDQIFDYVPEAAKDLSEQILTFPNMVYEAHSTDYQTEKGLKDLVGDHYCILKVGPWLTFAYREGIFLLSEIERELFGDEPEKRSRIVEVIEEVMLESPKDWKKYYSGSAEELAYKRKYSFSDRSRYYWPDERIQASVKVLMDNLSASPLPFALLSQYFPEEFVMIRDGELENTPEAVIRNRIASVLGIYSRACGISNN